MQPDEIETLPSRYKFILNQYKKFRSSKCILCNHFTHLRKFCLLIHINQWGFMAWGKTCRYCSRCELIVCHKDELETELVHSFEQHSPAVIGNPYQVIGTIEKRWWRQSLGRSGSDLGSTLKHTAPLKETLALSIEGGGWTGI